MCMEQSFLLITKEKSVSATLIHFLVECAAFAICSKLLEWEISYNLKQDKKIVSGQK